MSLKTPAKCRQRTVMLGRDAKFCAKDQLKIFASLLVVTIYQRILVLVAFLSISERLNFKVFFVGVAFGPLLCDHLYAILGLQDPQLPILLHGPA